MSIYSYQLHLMISLSGIAESSNNLFNAYRLISIEKCVKNVLRFVIHPLNLLETLHLPISQNSLRFNGSLILMSH